MAAFAERKAAVAQIVLAEAADMRELEADTAGLNPVQAPLPAGAANAACLVANCLLYTSDAADELR